MPIWVGRRVIISDIRQFTEALVPRDVVIKIDLAFGMGSHPTTIMCLELLEEVIRGREVVLDLGTGGGILALAANNMGAERVLAVDVDKNACLTALHNVRLNQAEKKIQVIQGSLEAINAELRFDMVLANLTSASILLRLLPTMSKALRPGANAILSGIWEDEERQLLSNIIKNGLEVTGRRQRDGWVALQSTKLYLAEADCDELQPHAGMGQSIWPAHTL